MCTGSLQKQFYSEKRRLGIQVLEPLGIDVEENANWQTGVAYPWPVSGARVERGESLDEAPAAPAESEGHVCFQFWLVL